MAKGFGELKSADLLVDTGESIANGLVDAEKLKRADPLGAGKAGGAATGAATGAADGAATGAADGAA